MAKPKVFVSHSHIDDAFAERLVKDLKAAGADAWLDKEQLGAGDFQERISEALDNCEWFLLVLTRAALASRWVRQEVHAANALKQAGQIKELIFIQAGPVEHRELPGLWRVYNILNGMAEYASTLKRTLTVVGITGAVAPDPGYSRQPQDRRPRQPRSGVKLVRPTGRSELGSKPAASGVSESDRAPTAPVRTFEDLFRLTLRDLEKRKTQAQRTEDAERKPGS